MLSDVVDIRIEKEKEEETVAVDGCGLLSHMASELSIANRTYKTHYNTLCLYSLITNLPLLTSEICYSSN